MSVGSFFLEVPESINDALLEARLTLSSELVSDNLISGFEDGCSFESLTLEALKNIVF